MSKSWHFPSHFKSENANVGPIMYSFHVLGLDFRACVRIADMVGILLGLWLGFGVRVCIRF